MALSWTAKAPDAVYRYSWVPPLVDGDSLSSFNVSVDGAVIDSQSIDCGAAVVFVSGGVAGETASFTFEATSSDGEVFAETVYLPIIAATAPDTTARDVVNFAVRKVFGANIPARAASDALERLNDMLSTWRMQGADAGTTYPLELGTPLLIADWKLSAIKNNLILQVADLYGMEVSPVVAMNARAGLQQLKQMNLSADRGQADYY